jgi:hypothetical protein
VQCLIVRENSPPFCCFPSLEVTTLDHICGIDNFPDLRRALDKR